MKVNFDTEAIDYLVNDMTQVFKIRQNTIDKNHVYKNKKKIYLFNKIPLIKRTKFSKISIFQKT